MKADIKISRNFWDYDSTGQYIIEKRFVASPFYEAEGTKWWADSDELFFLVNVTKLYYHRNNKETKVYENGKGWIRIGYSPKL